MNTFPILFSQNFSIVFSKTYPLKKIIGGTCPQTSLVNAWVQLSLANAPTFPKNFYPPAHPPLKKNPIYATVSEGK